MDIPRLFRRSIAAAALSFVVATPAAVAAAEPSAADQDHDQDRRAILAAGKAYQEALAKGDVETLARLWMPDGDIIDGLGTTLSARESLAAESAALKAGRKPPALALSEPTIRFLGPDVAIEDATAEVALAGGPKLRGRFTAGWVRTPEGWKLSFLREAKLEPPSAKAILADLEPLVGEWRLASGDPSIRMSARWNKDQTFLLRDMRIATDDGREIEITQRIGLDPVSGQVHSWNFSSDGGHGEGIWSRDGTSWVASTSAVSPGGVRSNSLNIYSFEDGERLRWRSFPTNVAESHSPPVDVVFVKTHAQGSSQSQSQSQGQGKPQQTVKEPSR